MTIYEATAGGPARLRFGGGVYEFRRQPEGMTLPNFAGGTKVSGDGPAVVIRNWTEHLEPAGGDDDGA